MPLDPVVNFFQSQIATLPVSDIATTIVITTNDGNKLPNPASSGAFNLTIFKDGDPFTDPEIVRVTAKSGDTLTVTRGQEGTIPSTKGASDVWKVVMFPTAKMITDIDSLKVNKAGDTMTGTLLAPKLVPTGNVTAGNGMYLPTTNTLAFSTNGAERVRVNASGNVGIGTSSPATKLHNNGTTLLGTGTWPITSIGLSGGRIAVLSNTEDQFIVIGNTNSTVGANKGAEIVMGAKATTGVENLATARIGGFKENATSGNFATYLKFSTSNAAGTTTERMRIDSAGNVGIGTTFFTPKLAVSQLGATALAGYINPSDYNARFEPSAIYGVARLGGGDLASNKDYAGVLGVGRVDPSGTPGAGHRIFGVLATESNGYGFDAKTFAFGAIGTSIFDGNVGVGVTPTSRNNTTLQINNGIGFPATQVASSDPNTLDDYEEGTFDLGISFGGSSTGVTYSNRQGKYTKIGRQVTVTGYILLSSKGTQTGTALITGLPFTIFNANANYSAATLLFNRISFANQFQGYGLINSTTIVIEQTTEAGVTTKITNADFANNSELIVSFNYFTT